MSTLTARIFRKGNRSIWLAALLIIGSLAYILLPQAHFALERRAGAAVNGQYWQQLPPPPTTTNQQTGLPMNLGTPIQLDMDRLDIHLPIIAGRYNSTNGKWLLDGAHAFFMSPGQFPLGANAQPLIYAHEIKGVFLNLNGLGPNEPLVITNSQGDKLFFRYVGDKVISPDQADQINALPAQRGLTLLTCTNPFFTQRRLFYFAYEQTVSTASAGYIHKETL